MVGGSGRRELLVSKGWVQAVALVVLFGFFVLGLLAYRTYTGQPPIPERVVDPEGNAVYTGEDVTAGQEVFLRNGIMEYGSIFGHGAYLGPDFTADYLRRSALSVRDSYGGEGSDRAAASTVDDFKENRYDSETGTLELTAPQAVAFEELRVHYGEPAEHMALGAFFSAAEVIPLTFLTVEAWSFLQLGARQESRSRTPFPHRWAVMFLVAVGFWNFLGAGIFGFLVNLPIISYYEIGTALTANHAHAAMMGVYGMLAAGLALFCLRYLIPEDRWSERAAKISFWSLNIGLAWMCFATLFPLGILQLYESVSHGYYEARTLEYITNDTNALFEWARLPGDVIFIVGGVLPLLYICYLGVRYTVPRMIMEEPEDILFTEITEPETTGPRER